MKDAKNISRRNFIKSSTLAASSLIMSSIIPFNSYGMSQQSIDEALQNNITDPILNGVCDIHIHAAPDSKDRSIYINQS